MQRACEQLAACCRSLGLSSQRDTADFVHLARLMRCAFALVACLVPVGSQQPAPRVKDVTLAECMVRSKALLELSCAVQRLIPPHTDSQSSDAGPCPCCSPSAIAWTQLVPFEERTSSGSGASTSSGGAAHTGSSPQTTHTASSRTGSGASASGRSTGRSKPGGTARSSHTKQQPPRISVTEAIQALLQRQLAVVVQFSAWLELAAASVSATTHLQLHARLQRLLRDAGMQLLLRAPESTSCRDPMSPLCLAQYFCECAFLEGAAPTARFGRLSAVIPSLASHGTSTRYLRRVMLARAALAAGLSGAATSTSDEQFTRCGMLLMLLCNQVRSQLTSLTSAQLAHQAIAGPPVFPPTPLELIARSLRAALWSWPFVTTEPCTVAQACTEAMADTALAVLVVARSYSTSSGSGGGGSTSSSSTASTAGSSSSSGASTGSTVSSRPSAAVIAALDCVAALAVDEQGVDSLEELISQESRDVLVSAAKAEKDDSCLSVGAGRPHKPRCAVSAILGLLAIEAHSGGYLSHGGESDEEEEEEPDQSVHTTFVNLAAFAAPTLQLVLQPLASALQQQSSAAGRGRVLAGVVSPPDVAAALTAAFTAVCGVVEIHWRNVLREPLCEGFDTAWPQLLDTSTTVTRALAEWLCADGGSSSGADCSRGSSGGGSASSSGGSSSWGQAHEAWRAALQDFRVCSTAIQVLVNLRGALDDREEHQSFMIASLAMEMLQPPHLATLSNHLMARLMAQLGTGPAAGPAFMRGPMRVVLQERGQQVINHSQRDLFAVTGFVDGVAGYPLTVPETLVPEVARCLMGHVLHISSLQAREIEQFALLRGSVNMPCFQEADSFPWLLCAVEWRDQLLRAAVSVSAVLGPNCEDADAWDEMQLQLLCTMLQLVWQLPVQLSQWAAAALDQPIEQVLARSAGPFAAALGGTSNVTSSQAGSSGSSTTGSILLCTPGKSGGRRRTKQGMATSIQLPEVVLASFPAVDKLAGKVRDVAAQFDGPDRFGRATRSPSFQLLWRASGEMCELLVAELVAVSRPDRRAAAQPDRRAGCSEDAAGAQSGGSTVQGDGGAAQAGGTAVAQGPQETEEEKGVMQECGVQQQGPGLRELLQARPLLPMLDVMRQCAGWK